MKTVNARITEKTTADLYHWVHANIYTGITEITSLSFYGTRATELTKSLENFTQEKINEAKKEWIEEHTKKVKELENKLFETITCQDGFFYKPSKKIYNELQKEKKQEWSGISSMYKHLIFLNFLEQYNRVKISVGNDHTIYEILPESK